MVDTWTLIDKRVEAFKRFYDQIDKTRKRLKLEAFSLTDYDGKTLLDNVISVTENRSASYVSRIVAGLMSSKWQTVIEGDISQREAHKIEQFLISNRQQADEYLVEQYGLAGLDAWLANHVCHTSLIGCQWLSYIDKEGQYKIHCLPVDMRHTPFVLNKWVAPITYRDKEDLLEELEEYRQAEGKFYTVPALKDTDNEVRDYWDNGKNELWVEKNKVFEQPNIYGKIPFAIVWPPSGFMFRDKGYLEYEAPGLLYLNEGLYDQISRQLSIDATSGFDPVRPAYQRPVKNPTAQPPIPPPGRGESVEVPEGELFQLLPRPDINKAQMVSSAEINRMIDEAAPMAPRAYTQPPSAIEVATEVELLDEIQNPRIIALQMFQGKLAHLIIDQFLFISKKGKTSSIMSGREGRKQHFTIADLKDPDKYFITYQLMKQNKRLAIVNESRALALWGKAPMKYILRDILGVEDPDGWSREMELEKAKAANPAISILDMAVRYAEEAEELEGNDKELKNWQSIMLQHDYVMLMRQKMQPAMPSEVENLREATKETGNAQGLMSLGGMRGASLAKVEGTAKGVEMP